MYTFHTIEYHTYMCWMMANNWQRMQVFQKISFYVNSFSKLLLYFGFALQVRNAFKIRHLNWEELYASYAGFLSLGFGETYMQMRNPQWR